MNRDMSHGGNSPADLSSYLPLAEAALQQYALGPADIAFIHHNAGIVFHVIAQDTKQHYMLKIHKRVGIGSDPSTEQLEPGLHWLADFAQASEVIVPRPILTSFGKFVGQMTLPLDTKPVCCTVQQWVDGRLPNGDFTLQHVSALGTVMAKLHAFSSTYIFDISVPATHHDVRALRANIRLLRATLPHTLLSSRDFDMVLAAEQRIGKFMSELGRSSAVWGPVHGDLHYDNVLLYNEEVRPIDFPEMRLGYYLYDIGVTMYHIFHQGIEIRRSLIAGYQQMYDLPFTYQKYIEAFITYAAIDNLAWNCTMPEQMSSPLFQQNLHNLVDRYCRSVAQKQHFLFA